MKISNTASASSQCNPVFHDICASTEEKLVKVQALVVEFSTDCAAIRAKNGKGCYLEAVVSW